MKSTHTHKGHCQACGRIQAVDNETQKVAKHGYKVAGFGFFMGTCSGSDKLALELDKTYSVQTIVALQDYITRHEANLADLRSGKLVPSTARTEKYIRAEYIGSRVKPGTGCYEEVPFAEANEYQQKRAVDHAISQTQYEIRQAQDHIKFLEKLIAEVHGKALRANKELNKASIEVGSKVTIYGTERVVTAIAYKTAHGIGPAVNGRNIEHVGYEVDGQTRWYPKRFARLVKEV